MAIKLADKTNVIPPGSPDYPFGAIKDDDGSNNGTPVDVRTYQDFHQFFAKLMSVAGVVYNDAQDGINGIFQYWTAITTVFLAKSGGIMTGSLTLNSNPTQPLEASTKSYSDSLYNALLATLNSIINIVSYGSAITSTFVAPTNDILVITSSGNATLIHNDHIGILSNIGAGGVNVWTYNSGYRPALAAFSGYPLNFPCLIYDVTTGVHAGFIQVSSAGVMRIGSTSGTITYDGVNPLYITFNLEWKI